jgi:hypothetical protein
VDHGNKHIVTDPNGERPLVRIVTDISCEENGLVRFVIPDGEKAESLPDGCVIEFEDVEGMFATNDASFEVIPTCWKKKQKSSTIEVYMCV